MATDEATADDILKYWTPQRIKDAEAVDEPDFTFTDLEEPAEEETDAAGRGDEVVTVVAPENI